MGEMSQGMKSVFMLALFLLFSRGVEAQDARLKAAVDACIQESSSGDCTCENGCGSYDGPIGQWNVSRVTNMSRLFLSQRSFNGDISNWDASQVSDMSYMWVSLFHKMKAN